MPSPTSSSDCAIHRKPSGNNLFISPNNFEFDCNCSAEMPAMLAGTISLPAVCVDDPDIRMNTMQTEIAIIAPRDA